MKQKKKMKPKVFAAIAKLIRSREPTKEGVRLVLTQGLTGIAAAKISNASPASVSNTVVRFRMTDAEIRKAYDIPSDESEE